MARTLKAVKKRARVKKVSNPKYETLADLLTLKLRSLYDIELEIQKALPKMAKAASDDGLREALSHHIEDSS